MRKASGALAIVAATLISACSLAPRDTRPELPTAAAYPETYAGDIAAGTRAETIGWKDFFADPRLTALVEAALDHNRDLAAAVAQVEEARGQYRIQRADRLPAIGIGADATRTRVGPENASIGTTDVTSGGTGTFTYDRYTAGAAVTSFELDFWGRVRNLSAAARSEYLASAATARAFRLTLIREVALAYLTSRSAAERLQLAEATVNSRREGLRIAKRRLDAGVTSALDYSQTETLLTQAETELAALRLTQAQSDN